LLTKILISSGYLKKVRSNPVSQSTFEREAKAQKLKVHHLKKDACDICEEMDLKKIDKTKTKHYREQIAALDEKEKFKGELPGLLNTECIVQDVQSVKTLPLLLCRAAFYKLKINFHNQTICDLKSKAVDSYLFTEGDAGCGAHVYCSIVRKF